MTTKTIDILISLTDPILHLGYDQTCLLCSRFSKHTTDDLFYLFVDVTGRTGLRKTFYCHDCIVKYFKIHIVPLEKINPIIIDDLILDLKKLWEIKPTNFNYKLEVTR